MYWIVGCLFQQKRSPPGVAVLAPPGSMTHTGWQRHHATAVIGFDGASGMACDKEDRLMTMRRVFCLCMATLSFATLSVSCSSTPTRYRGSLSDAMDKSRDDYEGDRTVPDEPRAPTYPQPESYPAYDYSESATAAPMPDGASGPAEFWIGVRGGNGYYTSRDMEPLADGDVLAGGETAPNIELDLYAGFRVNRAVSSSSLDSSIKDPLLFLKAGIEGRYSPLPDWPVLSPYLSAGMGGFYMGWNFRTPLISGSDTITSDSIGGFLMHIGAGVYIVRLDRFRVGIGIRPELYLFGAVTGEGFDNDYFDYFDVITVNGELAIRL